MYSSKMKITDREQGFFTWLFERKVLYQILVPMYEKYFQKKKMVLNKSRDMLMNSDVNKNLGELYILPKKIKM